MDNLTLSNTRLSLHQQSLTSTDTAGCLVKVPQPLLSNSDAIELTPPPPRLPPRAARPTESDAGQRPCPPLPSAPPLPAREPLHCSWSGAAVGTTGLPSTSSQLTTVSDRRTLGSSDRSSTPLDQVVPLAHWPLPQSQPVSSTGGGSVVFDKTHVLVEPHSHHHVVTPANVIVVTPAVVSQHPKLSHTSGNLYVDAPTLRRNVAGQSPSPIPGAVTGSTSAARHSATNVIIRASSDQLLSPVTSDIHRHNSPVVVTQPTSKSSNSAKAAPTLGDGGKQKSETGGASSCRGGITCSRCGRCRCEHCMSPRELPRRWIGGFECSCQQCVKVTSCFCCVEAIFYHCLDGGDEVSDEDHGGAVDDPCACDERPQCCLRWALMTALAATVLPCLCCYCPLQCTAEGLTACYNACAAPHGCRCQGGGQEASSGSSTRGLLAESESSST